MAYNIYLLQQYSGGTVDYVQLDTEDIYITTIFSVADIADISTRKDSITKNVSFKGTKANNIAFGNLFFLNRHVDTSIENRLFFNYAPIRTVDCLVYEDNLLILRGSMIVTSVSNDKYQNKIYNTTITGKFIDFRNIIQDKYLSDINLSNLQHHANAANIISSWGASTLSAFNTTELYSASTDTYYNAPFELGKNYVYPFIDYGVTFKSSANTDYNSINILNFRPAIYVKEIVDRLFNEAGFTYELKGDAVLQDKYKKLIIPNSDELMTAKVSGVTETFTGNRNDTLSAPIGSTYGYSTLFFNSVTDVGGTYNFMQIYPMFLYQTLVANKTFNSSYDISVTITGLTNDNATAQTCYLELRERPFPNPFNNDNRFAHEDIDSWKVISYKPFVVNGSSTFGGTITISGAEIKFTENYQYVLDMRTTTTNFRELGISACSLKFPSSAFGNAFITYESQYGDVLQPSLPVNIKQIDFLKSLFNQFNLYVYNTKDNPKHLILQSYDDYYALCSPQLLKNGLNWTNKIDYNSPFVINSNITIPKNYLFTNKEDNDFLNANYKAKYNEVYGMFSFTDALGIADVKKVESIYSSSPMVSYVDTDRLHPAILKNQTDNLTSTGISTKKPVKSNIRLLYFNGIFSGTPYSAFSESFGSAVYSATARFTSGTEYPMCSNYYYTSGNFGTTGTPVSDLNFGIAREFYFPVNDSIGTVPTTYNEYYTNQTTELTSANLFTAKAETKLNEIDISNLDLRKPVYIDTGLDGHGFFKVLNVEYTNNKSTSTVTLQKIGIVDSSIVSGGSSCHLTVNLTSTSTTGSTGTATAHVSGANGSVTYLWNNGNTGATITGLSAGTYSVTVTDSIGCTASGSVDVPLITIEDVCFSFSKLFSGGNLFITCNASDDVDVSVTVNFTYSVDGGTPVNRNIVVSAGNNLATVKIDNLTGTTVFFVITSISPTSSTYQTYSDCS